MNRKISIPIILALLVLMIFGGVLMLKQSVPTAVAAGEVKSHQGAQASEFAPIGSTRQAISITDAPFPVQVLVFLFVIFFVTLAVVPLLVEGKDAAQAGVLTPR